jgi:hypothetical protein
MRPILIACAALALLAVPAEAANPRIQSKPRLIPAFDRSVHDYVARCDAETPLRLRVRAPRGGSAAVDGGPRRHGRFRERVAVAEGRRVTVASRSAGRTARYHVRCLPREFPEWKATRSGRTQAGYYLVTPSRGATNSRFVAMFDPNGVPVWWYHAPTATFDASLLRNGHVAYSVYFPGDNFGFRRGQAYNELTLSGRRVRRIRTKGVPTDVHDLQRLPNGNFLVLAYKPRDGVDLTSQGGPANATVVDGVVQEITPSGRRVFQWNSKDHVALDERGPSGPLNKDNRFKLTDGRKAWDIFHINSVEPHGDGELLISARATSALYNIDRSSGEILWKLGGTETPQSLDFAGERRTGPVFGGQHDARVLRDGTVTVYDNALGRGAPPRAVRYRLDTDAGTATLLEDIRDPDIPESIFAGGARRLDGGNWVISWGGVESIGEYRPGGRQVFGLELDEDFFSYRAFPIARDRLSRRQLRRAMDAQYRR